MGSTVSLARARMRGMGRAVREAAAILKLTPRTIAYHKYEIMEQLGLKTGAELVQYAIEHKILIPLA